MAWAKSWYGWAMPVPEDPGSVEAEAAGSAPGTRAIAEPPLVVADAVATDVPADPPLGSETAAAEPAAADAMGPTIERIVPSLGSTLGATRVTLEGRGFAPGAEVKVDGVTVASELEADDRLVLTTLPRNLPGRVDIDVVNPDGSRALVIQGFEYCLPPKLASAGPGEAPAKGGTLVTLTGEHLREGSSVRVGASVPEVRYVGPGRIDLELVAHPAGTYDVELTGPDGQIARLEGGFVFHPAPRLDRVAPNHGPLSGGTRVVVAGEGFRIGCALFLYNARLVADFVSGTELAAIVPPHAAPGPVTLRLENPDGSQAELSGAFHYDSASPPRLEKVEPAGGGRGRENSVVLVGDGFADGAAVFVMGASLSVRFVSSERLEVTLPALDSVGFLDIEVENLDGQRCRLERAFELQGPPVLARVAPVQAGIAGGRVLELAGGGFRAGCRVELGGAEAECEWVSEAALRVVLPRRSGPGRVDVVVTNPDGQAATLASAFEYVAPTAVVVARLEPSAGPTSGRTAVLLTGEGLDRVARVFVGGEPALELAAKGAGALTFLTPPRRSTGLADVTLAIDDGSTITREKVFRYEEAPVPVIRSVSPNRGAVAGKTEVTISGQHFAQGCRVLIDGAPVGSLTVKNATTLVVSTPPGKPGRMADVCVESSSGKRAVAPRAYLYDARYR
jgi:hypothetical protein